MYCEHLKGLRYEQIVLSYYLDKNWILLGQRIKTPFAEVDLLLKQGKLLKLIEVKSLGNEAFMNYRIRQRQKERLIKAGQFLHFKWKMDVELEIVFVDNQEELTIIPLD
ncbi:MAG: YraN family protein [Bdellovibrionaceae bacterium]|nr:YraN family protein [Pseudobdellovibrionaceae bacterium]NUM59338.1 YraN family protein [Pseudobdellovibrionaceae bacterium]